MPGPLVALFWIWVLVSIGIIAYRVVTTGTWRSVPKTAADDSDRGSKRGKAKADAREAERAAFEAKKAAFEAKLEANKPPTPEPTPVADQPTPGHSAPTTLIEALSGIAMPCDLVPLPGAAPDAQQLTFTTTSASAEEIVAAVAAELDRLGFATDENGLTIAATRDAAAVHVQVAEQPASTGDPDQIFTKHVHAEFTLVAL